MAIQQYHNFLTLAFTHTFFGNKQCAVLKLIPFESTVRAFKNYELLEKKHNAQTSLFIKGIEEEQQDFSVSLKGIPELFFKLKSTDNYFFNYTEIPFLKEGELFCFCIQENKNQLQKAQYVSEKDVIKVFPLMFSLPLSSNKTVAVLSERKELLFNAEVNDPQQKTLVIDLRAFGSGIYNLLLDGELKECFFGTEEAMEADTIGIVKLSLENVFNIKPEPQLFEIAFIARSVYWQYSIVIPEKRKIEVLEISVESDKGTYAGPEEGSLVNGQKAQVFRSSNLIPLQERIKSTPNLLVTYANEFSSRKNHMEQKLPCPSIEQFSGQLESKFIVSSIVYF